MAGKSQIGVTINDDMYLFLFIIYDGCITMMYLFLFIIVFPI